MPTDSELEKLSQLDSPSGSAMGLSGSATGPAGSASGLAGSGLDKPVVESRYEMQNPDVLIAAHQGLLISIADSIYRRVPRHIPREDLLAYGQVGLVQAARTFRPQPDAEFGTYAYYRISGAIYEGLTRMNWTSRAEYRRRKAEEAANDVMLQDAENRGVATANQASSVDTPADQAAWLGGTVQRLSAVYLLSQLPGDEQECDDPTDSSENPCQAAVGSEIRDIVNHAITGLPEDAQRLIRLVYFEDHSLAQAAQVLGRSRSWASRLHSSVLEKLAIHLAGVVV